MADDPTVKLYTYWAAGEHGVYVQLPIQAFGSEPPTAEMVEGLYLQIIAAKGIGAVPRPTHYTETELHEMPKGEKQAQRSMIVVPKNGAKS